MRLIDADLLQKHFEKVKKESERLVDVAQIIGVQAVIDSQPTAYDVDKVSEKLQNELNLADKEKERCAKENLLQFDESKGYARGMAVAIEIVKTGGIDGH